MSTDVNNLEERVSALEKELLQLKQEVQRSYRFEPIDRSYALELIGCLGEHDLSDQDVKDIVDEAIMKKYG